MTLINTRSLNPKHLAESLKLSYGSIGVGLALILSLAGCTTPDLQPFATATQTVASSIKQGGDQLVSALANETIQIDGKLIAPGAQNHPAKAFEKEWGARKKAADAILVYSASLAAIGEASSNRKANATALYESVQNLASAVPGVGVGSSAAGNLLVTATGVIVEVKAWHDMASAVRSADPAVQAIADVLKADFASIGDSHVELYRGILRLHKGTNIRSLENLRNALVDKRTSIRDLLSINNADPAGDELNALEIRLAPIQRDLDAHAAESAHLETQMADADKFYAQAIATVDAWAAAHSDLAQALSQNRRPNLALLLERARELNDCVTQLKSNR